MRLYSYVITRDYGFAPNPFWGYCTLATCKPKIRKSAQVGDWIVGIGSGAKNSKMKGRLVYAMKVEQKITFDEYWKDTEFQNKKPVMNGSKRQNYGDNIYHSVGKKFVQEDSHHSLANGSVNKFNLKKDIGGGFVLISKTYWYFGKESPLIPQKLQEIIVKGRSYRIFEEEKLIFRLENWLRSFPESGRRGNPLKFDNDFERYNGIS
ncbi:hypothetical protein FACS189427_07870 [Planctomycetales bacterium]|nr:hypothetical protein FACS189427_07870 [Planctomycetales bacterium]